MSQPAEKPQTSAWAMYRAIVGIGALCALVIVVVFQSTAARISENQARFLAAAISDVLPVTRSTLAVDLDAEGRLTATGEQAALPVFLSYDESGDLAGAVLTGQGMGYQDNIRLLYAYSFEARAIVGMKILDSKETPGRWCTGIPRPASGAVVRRPPLRRESTTPRAGATWTVATGAGQ